MALQSINEREFRRMTGEEQPVLVEFWAPWCVYCRRIAPALNKVAEQKEADIRIVQVNIDEEPELARQERIEVIPTLVVYQNGYDLGSVVAPDSKRSIEQFLEDTL